MKSLVPIHPDLRTKAQRVRAVCMLQTLKNPTLVHVEVCIGSRRKSTKGIQYTQIVELFHVVGPLYTLAIVKLRDGRFVFLDRRNADHIVAVVSHDLENLWWYGVRQSAREAFTYAIKRASKNTRARVRV